MQAQQQKHEKKSRIDDNEIDVGEN